MFRSSSTASDRAFAFVGVPLIPDELDYWRLVSNIVTPILRPNRVDDACTLV
jgi:hypothetical protein